MNTAEKVLSFLLLISYLIKIQVMGAQNADAFVIAGLSLLVGFLCYLGHVSQPDIEKQLMEEIESRDLEIKRLLTVYEKELTKLKDDMGQVGLVAQRNGGNVQNYKF